ncbi:hypothetical protein PO878_04190 [Iamia majanohamensis]|uniref:Uncharacterized protein n=1 Tax=Iamia majanohamensis TaxID=467976 RepID=A0AAE9YB79_9ACTN|nr:hypothetical protein [Iamia majanohamensis]WCO67923.1 hypothetical protein PO878_04190 [Iamia majanohamensis]
MGLFSKTKKGTDPGAARPGVVGVEGMGPIHADPALLGGPSTAPLSEDDPMLAPVDGMSIEMYGHIAREAQARGITDEAGMVALAGELHGLAPAEAQAAFATWIERMGRSMVVGQQLRRHMGY